MGASPRLLYPTQGTLFFDVARIIAHHQPKAFLLENVKNLTSHDRGNTFRVILNTLQKELGYSITWRVVDAKGFVPQHRERILIAGFREPSDFGFDIVDIPDPDSGPRLPIYPHPENGTEPVEPRYTRGDNATVLDKYTLTPGLWDI